MAKLFSPRTSLVLLIIIAFSLFNWTAQSTTLFSMHHQLQKSVRNADGSLTLSFAIEISNHSTSDLSAIQLVAINQAFIDHSGKQPALSVKSLPSGETAVLKWTVRTQAANTRSQIGELIFTGIGHQENSKNISLTITSLESTG